MARTCITCRLPTAHRSVRMALLLQHCRQTYGFADVHAFLLRLEVMCAHCYDDHQPLMLGVFVDNEHCFCCCVVCGMVTHILCLLLTTTVIFCAPQVSQLASGQCDYLARSGVCLRSCGRCSLSPSPDATADASTNPSGPSQECSDIAVYDPDTQELSRCKDLVSIFCICYLIIFKSRTANRLSVLCLYNNLNDRAWHVLFKQSYSAKSLICCANKQSGWSSQFTV